MNATRASGDHVGVSAISLAEMVYLIEKGRIPEDSLDALLEAIADPNLILRLVPVDDGVVVKMKDIPRAHVPDLPDRIVAATALHFNVPVLSRDGRITSSAVQTIW